MNKLEIIQEAQNYSKQPTDQKAYISGFKAACNIIRQKINECYNDEFCEEMEELANISYMDFEEDNDCEVEIKDIKYGVCRVCGCTDNNPCYNPKHGNCWWDDEKHTICSHCADRSIKHDPSTVHCINNKTNER